MSTKAIACIVYIAIITLSSVYITQPLLPLLAWEFHTSIYNISAITSITLLPMAFAPLLYGYFLENYPSKAILTISLLLVGIFQLLLALCENFMLFLCLRFLQSLFFPAILTALLTILTRLQSQSLQLNISIYIASTIAGGLLGRVGGASLSDIFSWQICFIALGVSLLLSALLAFIYINPTHTRLQPITFKQMLPFLSNKTSLIILSSVFVMFFSFQALLNTLPFHAKDIFPSISQNQIGALYWGYSIGIFTSLGASWLTQLLGGRYKCVFISLNLFALSLCIFLIDSLPWIYAGVFAMCIGSFLAHSVLSAINNALSAEHKAVLSGLYLSFYYMGGALGSYLSSFIYQMLGWRPLICALALLLSTTSVLFYTHMRKLQ
ncbi:MFS transporter [Helicobacter marmotae]|uniref:MFS transporter n=1 Tax=Helicobacter marmotae TaxID=152490 RepID=A0A3D8I671_9HELI|nr:MFS transporter [Helicobacter marmotae]RDU60652.1 MFS transporter [Helicobacter marmotae]